MLRIFIALPIPEEIEGELDRLCAGLPGIRWTQPGSFHLTLRFIGEVPHPVFCEIGEELMRVRADPFELALKGLGQFPPKGAIKTLWAGVEQNESLLQLRRQVERVLRGIGVDPEARKYIPHVTLGRFIHPPPVPRLASYLSRRSLFQTVCFPVSEFCLFSSHLRPEGAEHVLEAEYNFVSGAMERI